MNSPLSISSNTGMIGPEILSERSGFSKALGGAGGATGPDFQQEIEHVSLLDRSRSIPEEESFNRLAATDKKMAALQKSLIDLRAKKIALAEEENATYPESLAQMGLLSQMNVGQAMSGKVNSGQDSEMTSGKRTDESKRSEPTKKLQSIPGLLNDGSSAQSGIFQIRTAQSDLPTIRSKKPNDTSSEPLDLNEKIVAENNEKGSILLGRQGTESGSSKSGVGDGLKVEAGREGRSLKDSLPQASLKKPTIVETQETGTNFNADELKALLAASDGRRLGVNGRSEGATKERGQSQNLSMGPKTLTEERELNEVLEKTRHNGTEDRIRGNDKLRTAIELDTVDYSDNLDQLPAYLLAENGMDVAQTNKPRDSRSLASRGSNNGSKANVLNETFSGGDFLNTLNLVKDRNNSDTLSLTEKNGEGDSSDPRNFGKTGLADSMPKGTFKSSRSNSENLALDSDFASRLEPRLIPIDTRTFNMVGNLNSTELSGQVVQGAGTRDRLSTDSLLGISNQISRLTPQGGGEIRIRLKPENLGELTVRVITDGSRVGLQIRASDDRSKKIIEESINSLRDSLSSQSLTLSHVDLSTIATPTSRAGSEFGDSNQFNSMSNLFQQGSQNFLGQNTNQSLNQDSRQDGLSDLRELRAGSGFRPNSAPLMAGAVSSGAWNSSGRLDVMG